MRVLVAPDRFGALLTAAQSAEALARGWRAQAPDDELDLCPLSDGSTGFLDAVAQGTSHELVPVTVRGPLGEPRAATILLVAGRDGARTAYLEAGQAVGPHLLAGAPIDRTRTTSHGVGHLLAATLTTGARRVIVGCGPAVSHDGGAGLLAALGAGADGLLGRGARALGGLPDDAVNGLADVRRRFSDVDLVVATDSVLPLLGFHGLSATMAQSGGMGNGGMGNDGMGNGGMGNDGMGDRVPALDAELSQRLENALGSFADLAQRSLVAGRPLSGRGHAGEPGSGCGGGVGFALLLLGARRVSGVSAVMDAVGLPERLPGTDVVLTAERSFDRASLQDQVVAEVADAATQFGIPTVVVAGLVELGRREALAAGVAGAYALAERPADVPRSASSVEEALAVRARRIARTWSR